MNVMNKDQAHYKKVIDDVQALFEAKREEAAIWQAAYETEKGFREQEKQELEAKRKWRGLTDEEVWEMDAYKMAITDQETRWLYRFARAIEAKLKEKNNG